MKPKLLYILAPSYSGSTLLTHLLAYHPSISTVGELKATQMGDIDSYNCSCGQAIRACGFWREMIARCAADGIPFDLEHFDTVLKGHGPITRRLIGASVRNAAFETLRKLGLTLLPWASANLRRQVRRNFDLSQLVCSIQGGPIFLDGSKDATRLLHFIESGLWDTYTIYLQRDGRGVTNSIAKYYRLDFDEAGAVWAQTVRELELMRGRLADDRVLDMRYEDLCSAPEQHLGQIFRWLDLEETTVNTADVRAGGFHILGNNNMRLGAVTDIRLDEKWRTKLTDEQKTSFMQRYGRAQKKLGYA